MPPKKDSAGPADAGALLVGFLDKETKLLAAAFVSSLGPDKYDYDVMAQLTGNTVGSLKKMWPPVKKKAWEAHPSFAKFLGASAPASADNAKTDATVKPAAGRKRKAVEADSQEDGDEGTESAEAKSNEKPKGKKAPAAKARATRSKKAKKQETPDKEEPKKVQKQDTSDEEVSKKVKKEPVTDDDEESNKTKEQEIIGKEASKKTKKQKAIDEEEAIEADTEPAKVEVKQESDEA